MRIYKCGTVYILARSKEDALRIQSMNGMKGTVKLILLDRKAS